MRLALVAACVVMVSGCDSLNQKVAASRQDRCERADWALVGERDGVAGPSSYAECYEYICGAPRASTGLARYSWKPCSM